jgi:hypothetical protein
MRRTTQVDGTRTLEHRTSTAESALLIREDCVRALRRLNVLIRERDDVLLVQARDSVAHAAALSAAELRARPAGHDERGSRV